MNQEQQEILKHIKEDLEKIPLKEAAKLLMEYHMRQMIAAIDEVGEQNVSI